MTQGRTGDLNKHKVIDKKEKLMANKIKLKHKIRTILQIQMIKKQNNSCRKRKTKKIK